MPQFQTPNALKVKVTNDTLSVDLLDGRTIAVPLLWFPRLAYGSVKERNHWELMGQGIGIHWPDLDEDVSVESLLMGRMSGESQKSLQKWLDARQARKPRTREANGHPRRKAK